MMTNHRNIDIPNITGGLCLNSLGAAESALFELIRA